MSYRPICDMWLLARPKVSYYGAYPNGFLERARTLMGINKESKVLHVCGGKLKEYPTWNKLAGPYEKTLDIRTELEPDIVWNATGSLPPFDVCYGEEESFPVWWDAILADPPYSLEDAAHYGDFDLPTPNFLLQEALKVLKIRGRFGLLHYVQPSIPANAKLLALIGIVMGANNKIRLFSVFEKLF